MIARLSRRDAYGRRLRWGLSALAVALTIASAFAYTSYSHAAANAARDAVDAEAAAQSFASATTRQAESESFFQYTESAARDEVVGNGPSGAPGVGPYATVLLDVRDKARHTMAVTRTDATDAQTRAAVADVRVTAARNARSDAMATLIGLSATALVFTFAASGWIAVNWRSGRRACQTGVPNWHLDMKGWSAGVTVGLINGAVQSLDHPDDRTRYAEEWAADANEIPPGWRQLRWALLLRLFASRSIRAARRHLPGAPPPQRPQ